MAENSSREPKVVYLLLMYQLLKILALNNLELSDCTLAANYLGEIVDLIQGRKINKITSEVLLQKLLDKENILSPTEMVEKYNLGVISSPKELKKMCLKVIETDEGVIELYKKKNKKHKKAIFNELVKKVLEESQFRADTQVLTEVMSQVLDEATKEK